MDRFDDAVAEAEGYERNFAERSMIRRQVKVRMSGNKCKEGKTRGRIILEGKWWLLGDTREPPKKPPGIFHVELKELAGILEAKKELKSCTLYARRKVGMQRTFKLPFMHTTCTHIGCFDNTDKWGYRCHLL